MVIRNIKKIEARNLANDFRLNGMLGRSLGELKVGIVGTGVIGLRVLENLSGFGCEMYYCNRSPSPAADKLAHRVELDELLETCDIVSIHTQLNGETYHSFNGAVFEKMKKGAVLINTARGAIVDTEALIEALESGKLGGAGIDVVEDEFSYYYYDCSGTEIANPYMDRLRAMDNVVFTHHMAFYCEASVRGMAVNSMKAIKAMGEGKEIPHRLARIGTGSSAR
jgi:D-lactate dehydrogenase